MRATQHFTKEYLQHCSKLSVSEILQFLEDFRQLHGERSGSKLISMKVPESLLAAFKMKARLNGVRYQTQIKKLMESWLLESETKGSWGNEPAEPSTVK